jgi:Flp pilus assembly protein TadB
MGERDASTEDPAESGNESHDELRAEIEELREHVSAVESEVEDRTVHREEIETDLRKYVRARIRRGYARGWGPYLVLLYGTAMTIAAFYLLSGGWAILAMIIVWLSTLGLYTLMVLVGAGITALSAPGRAVDAGRTAIDALRKLRP